MLDRLTTQEALISLEGHGRGWNPNPTMERILVGRDALGAPFA